MSGVLADARWPEARALFDRALALPVAEREAFVAREAAGDATLEAEVRSLLGALAGAGEFLGGERVGPLASADEVHEPARKEIGSWRVVSVLGRGGMGVVYLAERIGGDFQQRAAIKVVSGGPENAAIVERFRAERRILAGLDHPGIARLLDGGTTADGAPYFVLEYVEGEELLSYADRRRLDVPARVRLFSEVCAAVEHAHSRLVLHRDLKPSNILVDSEGRPKLLDFGIGKLLSPDGGASLDRTSTMERWLTPRYASPEQILGEPTTTATDVYGLGVVLFELLSGMTPYRFKSTSPRDIESAVLEQSPRRLSTAVADPAGDRERAAFRGSTPPRLRRALQGDLETIVARALEREPSRRYSAAAELAADLGRFLRGEPVSAQRASLGYRSRKFVGRHRLAVAGATAALALVAGLTVIYGARLRAERDRARLESERAREATGFLANLLAGADPNKTRGATLTLRQFLAEAPPKVEASIAEPRVRADVLHVIGEAQWHAGAQREAVAPLTEALALRERELGPDHPDTGKTLTVLGAAKGAIGEIKEGQALLQRGIGILESSLGPEAGDLVWPLDRLAILYLDEDLNEAVRLAKRALRIHYAAGTPLADRAYLLQHLAVFARGLGDNKRGAALYLSSYEVSSATLGPESPLAANALCNAARTFNEIGESQRALGLQQRAEVALEKAWGGDNVQLAGCIRAGAETLVQLDRLDEARAQAERAYAMDLRLYGEQHMQTMNMLAVIAWVASVQGHVDEAAEMFTRFLDFQKAQGGTENHGWVTAYMAQARKKLAHGDRSGAESQLRDALALQRKELAAGEAMFVPTLIFLAELVQQRGALDEARALVDEAVSIAQAKLAPEQRDRRAAMAADAELQKLEKAAKT